MRIDHLQIRNYAGIEHFQHDLHPSFNVLIGENGSGKSTVLEVLSNLLSGWIYENRPLFPAHRRREWIRLLNRMPSIEQAEPAEWTARWRDNRGRSHELKVSASDPHPKGPSGRRTHPVASVRNGQDAVVRQASANGLELPPRPLPVVALFTPQRTPGQLKQAPSPQIVGPQERDAGYKDALDVKADFRQFVNWLRTFDLERLRGEAPFPAVEAARQAVCKCLPLCMGLEYVPSLDEVMMRRSDGAMEPLWRLSDGYRGMLAMVGEIAYRAAILNPGMPEGQPENVSGVVLIDELDLHLHPRWQRRVVEDLRRVFPNIQFITTTHSPFIVQSMRREEVISLDRAVSMDFWREGLEDISAQAMGVDEEAMGGDEEQVPRSLLYRRLEKAAGRYYQLLDESPEDSTAIAQQRAELDQLEELFSSDPAMVALLRRKRLMRQAPA